MAVESRHHIPLHVEDLVRLGWCHIAIDHPESIAVTGQELNDDLVSRLADPRCLVVIGHIPLGVNGSRPMEPRCQPAIDRPVGGYSYHYFTGFIVIITVHGRTVALLA